MSAAPSSFNLADYFLGEDRLRQIGKRTAVEFRDTRITYEELCGEVNYWSDRILECAVIEGERVALLLYDSPEFIACFLATTAMGAVCVPINTFLSDDDIAFILSDSGARLVIAASGLEAKVNSSHCVLLTVDAVKQSYVHHRCAATLPAAIAATTRETPAFLLYTSGSTGTPKGVLHLHGSIPDTVETYARNVLSLTGEDRIYSASRMFFAYGLGNSLSFPLAAGATVVLEPDRMNAEQLVTFIKERAPTVFFAVPAVYLALLEFHATGGQVDLGSVRLCVSAGEALPATMFDDWKREFGFTILDGIGSTEMLHIFISNREGHARGGSSGTVVNGYAARLIDDAGNEVGPNELGNLWVLGSSATAGYWNRPDLTSITIKDGWVHTGDVYRRDEESFFYHIGRSDDCFKVKGLWVSPIEVESVLVSHQSVSEAGVISAVDESGLATARAYVVIRQDEPCEALKEELRKFVGSQLPHYKVPSQIVFIEEMPRTSTGKIQRYKLRAEDR
ncbi:MAG: benzoate-CoA ligase family protein [Blastocatellia bacterium]